MSVLLGSAKRIVKRCLRLDRAHGKAQDYLDARATVAAAQAAGQTICEYVESLWNQRGATLRVFNEMKAAGLQPCERILEIGPGTGRYLDLVCGFLGPKQYDIYEIADDWAEWLAHTHSPPVARQPVDGHTLEPTPTASCGLVHAHGVFVYLRLINAYEYFLEMLRVCMPGGFLIFDYFPAETFDEDMILHWLNSQQRYPVVLMDKHIRCFFEKRGCDLIREFDNQYGCGHSHYLVFQKGKT